MNALSLLLVASVALPRLDLRLGALLHVLRKRTPHVVRLLELPLLVASHVTLVRARVDQLAVTFLCHFQVTPFFFTSFPTWKISQARCALRLLFAPASNSSRARSKTPSSRCRCFNTGPKRSPLRSRRRSMFLRWKSEVLIFFRSTSFHSSDAETVAPGFGRTE